MIQFESFIAWFKTKGIYEPQQPRSYIKSVVAYCRRKGNERLIKTLFCIGGVSEFNC